MERSEVMMVNAGNAGAGSRDRAAVLGPRSGLLDRRSFLFGSAFSVGALSLAGCVTQDGMSVAAAYGSPHLRPSRNSSCHRNSDRRLPGRDLATSALVPTTGSRRAYQIACFAARLA